MEADGNRIKVGRGDAGPVLADWDRDGLLDLIVGAGDGSVTLYRNRGTKAEPALEEGRLLLAASDREKQDCCGTRTKVCVTDYNGDGHLDLLVGDFASVRKKQPERTPEQQAEVDKAKEEYQEIIKEYSALYQKSGLSKLYLEYRALQEERDSETADETIAREKKADELMERIQAISNKELKSIRERMVEIRKRMGTSQATYHGFVWLYLRKQPADSTAAGG